MAEPINITEELGNHPQYWWLWFARKIEEEANKKAAL